MSDNNSKNNTMYIAVGALVLVAIVGTAIYFGTKNNNSDTKKGDNSAMMQDDKMKKDETVMVGGAAMYANKDIVSNVVNAPNLTTLVTAVKAADLVATLQGPGPFTVFGPDNDAFAKLPAGTVETLLKPENKEQLVDILTYHVVSGKFVVADLKDGQELKTVQGGNLKITKVGSTTMVNGAKISTADVLQSNGVAHVIDSVLSPSQSTAMVGGASMFANKDIVSNVVNAPNLSTLVAAVKAADLVATLQGPGPFTVFGPDNNAFAKLPAGTVETLVKPENKATLTKILTYHAVAGRFLIQDLKDGQVLKTVQGGTITVIKSGNTVTLKDESGAIANIVTPDVIQSNGVAHVIDTVLTPAK